MHKKLLLAAVFAAAAAGAYACPSGDAPPPGAKKFAPSEKRPGRIPASITRQDFISAAVKRFDELDLDGDGVVTAEERLAFRQARVAELRTNGLEPIPHVRPALTPSRGVPPLSSCTDGPLPDVAAPAKP